MKIKILAAVAVVLVSSSSFADCLFTKTGSCEAGKICTFTGNISDVTLNLNLGKTSTTSVTWSPSKNKDETTIINEVFEISGQASKGTSQCPIPTEKSVGSYQRYIGCDGTRINFYVDWKFPTDPKEKAIDAYLVAYEDDDHPSRCFIGRYATNLVKGSASQGKETQLDKH